MILKFKSKNTYKKMNLILNYIGKRNIEFNLLNREYNAVSYFLDLPMQDVKKVYENYNLLINTPMTKTIFKYDK